MKKLLICLLLLCLALPALGEEDGIGPLTGEEIHVFVSRMAEHFAQNGAVITPDADGTRYTAELPGASMTLLEDNLASDAKALSIRLEDGAYSDNRALLPGATLGGLLSAYPNDNPALKGTYYEAALYLRGDLSSGAAAGYLVREGQRVVSVQHVVYVPMDQEQASRLTVRYQIAKEQIVTIEILGMNAPIPLSQAQEELTELAALQEQQEYAPAESSEDGLSLSAFQREDLRFSGLDFLDLTPENAVARLGESQVDEWIADTTGETLRVREWEDVEITFVYDADKNYLYTASIALRGDSVEGPRGVRTGDSLSGVKQRFRFGEGVDTLYGDGVSAPYGLLSQGEGYAALTYAMLDGENTILLYLSFSGDTLQEIMIYRM